MELHELTATGLRDNLATGKTTADEILQSCRSRIAAQEDRVHAWAHLPDDSVPTKAVDDAKTRHGLLYAIPVAFKDIIETVDMPTTYGSKIYRDNRTPWDASCVSLVREAGGIPLGKTVSTEFAYFSPGPTANPHNIKHTPGGSSSGSAAAVAAKMVPLAFGSQTAGSVIRPASYCGVVGFKSSYGSFCLAGIKTLAHSLDTLGWFARSVDDIALMRSALLREDQPLGNLPARAPKIGLCRTPFWDEADASSQQAVETAAEALAAAGAQIIPLDLPPLLDDANAIQRRVMNYEVARALAFERNRHADKLSDVLRSHIDEGLGISDAAYAQAKAHSRNGRHAFAALMEDVDFVLTPSAPGEAPAGLDATGDPIFNRIWTLLGVPAVNLPTHTGPNGLPIGIQLIGGFGRDLELLNWAHWAENRLS